MPRLNIRRLLPPVQVAALVVLVAVGLGRGGTAIGHLALAAAHLMLLLVVASYFGARTLRFVALVMVLAVPVELASLGQNEWDASKRAGFDPLRSELVEQLQRERPAPLTVERSEVAEINALARTLLAAPADGATAGGAAAADATAADAEVGDDPCVVGDPPAPDTAATAATAGDDPGPELPEREQGLIDLRSGLLGIQEGLAPPDPAGEATDDVRTELGRVVDRLARQDATEAEITSVLADVEQLTRATEEFVCRAQLVQDGVDDAITRLDEAVETAAGGGATAQPVPEEVERTMLRTTRQALNQLAAAASDEDRRAELVARAEVFDGRVQAVSGPSSPKTIIDLGAIRLFDDLYRTLFRRPAPIDDSDLGWVTWLGTIIVAIVGYRNFEILNGRREPGPVVVEVDQTTRGHEDVGPRFKELLGLAELYEPAALPLGTTGRQVVEILQRDPGTPSVVIQTVITLLQATAFPARGIVATVRYVHPGEVTVRVRERRGSRSQYVKQFRSRVKDESLRSAAAYVASTSIRRSWVTPAWATWSASAGGQDLAAYQQVVHDRLSLPEQRKLIRTAIAVGPTSALALAKQAELVSTTGNRDRPPKLLQALAYDLRALDGHKRFVVARWRAMASMSMIAGEPTFWTDDPEGRQQLRRLAPVVDPSFDRFVRQAVRADGSDPDAIDRQQRCAVVAALRAAAERERRRLRRLLFLPTVLTMAVVVQSERDFWWRMVLDWRRRARQRAALRIARSLIALRGRALDCGDPHCANHRPLDLARHIGQVQGALRAAPDDAVVLYNAACFFSVASDVSEADLAPPRGRPVEREVLRNDALELLIRANQAENGPEITHQWMVLDPDLEPLRREIGTRFGRFVATVADDERLARDGRSGRGGPTTGG